MSDDIPETEARPAIAWKREISVGNLLSALSMIVVATIFIISIRNSSELETTKLQGQMQVYAARLDQLGRDFGDFKSATERSNTEVRQKLDAVSGMIGDMRVLIAGTKDGKR